MSVAYLPYGAGTRSVEAQWLAEALACPVDIVSGGISLNVGAHAQLPPREEVLPVLDQARGYACIVAEGTGGFAWAALARAGGLRQPFAILPYVNPATRFDYTAIAAYADSADPRDRIFVGSTASARIYAALGIPTTVAEPFGIDCEVFRPASDARAIVERLGLRAGAPLLLFAGRVEPDKDVRLLLAVALKARLLLPELQVVIAAHVVDEDYATAIRRIMAREAGLHLVEGPDRTTLAALYGAADAFVTASTSHFETFGRAPAEALACGTTAIAPRFDGFAEVLAQPGGKLVDLEFDASGPRVGDAALLRAIYEALALPPASSRAHIATTARQRFCRGHTIGVLRYLDGSAAAPPASGAAAIELTIPEAWRSARARVPSSARELADRLWGTVGERDVAVDAASFRTSVRNALAHGAAAGPEAAMQVSTCH